MLSLGLVAVLVVDAAGVTGRLVVDLVEGGPETNSATDLLKTGFLVWLYTILLCFSTGYLTEVVESRFLAAEFDLLEQLNAGRRRAGA